jgi:hypothetical protein
MKYLNFLIFSAFIGFTFTACKKDKETEPKQIPTNQTDQEGASAIDDAIEDISDIISNKIGGGASQSSGRVTAYNLPCGIIKLDSNNTNGETRYTVQYGQNSPCGSKKKSGSIAFYLTNGNTFAQANAVYSIVFTNYKVEWVATEKEVTVNGTLTVSNINGHYIWEAVVFNKTIKHKVRGKLLITFENGEVRERNHFQLRTWASNNGWQGLSFSIEGDTLNNISETGYTIDGNHYYQTQIIDALTWSNCGNSFTGPYVLKTGHAKMNVDYPNISDAFIDVEAGYYINTKKLTTTPSKVNDCNANTYKIVIKFATFESTQYQLY